MSLIINNRPDGEEAGQITGAQIEQAARDAGLDYRAIPIGSAGFGEAGRSSNGGRNQRCFRNVLAYCRTGTRSTLLWSLAQAYQGGDPEEIAAHAKAAGYDVTPVRAAMDMLFCKGRPTLDDLIRQLLQLAASLAAILALAWLAGRLRLGGDIRITDADHARRLADEVLSGFDPVDIVVDRSGYGALLRDGKGRIMLLRQHGAHFAGTRDASAARGAAGSRKSYDLPGRQTLRAGHIEPWQRGPNLGGQFPADGKVSPCLTLTRSIMRFPALSC